MADDAPVMFKRKAARPKQRSRPAESGAVAASEAVSDTAGSGEDSPSVVAAKLKNKLKSRDKPKTKLSFGADEDVSNRLSVRTWTMLTTLTGGRWGSLSGEEVETEPQAGAWKTIYSKVGQQQVDSGCINADGV